MRKFGGSWSESKLGCVEDYARSYLQVMQKQEWCSLDYIDAFAGRGRQVLKSGSEIGDSPESFFGNPAERADTEEFVIGSAVRALHASASSKRGFDRFIFIDADKRSCQELESLVGADFPKIKSTVRVIPGDANRELDQYVIAVNWAETRALAFLDPYGLEVNWELIQRLASTEACDVWYLFPLGGVIRMMKTSGQIPETWSARLNRVFGTDDWYPEFYKPSVQGSLFVSADESRLKNASTDHVIDYVRSRLKSAFPAVSNPGILRNGKGAPLFALFLGVSNPGSRAQKAALRIANHLVKGLSE